MMYLIEVHSSQDKPAESFNTSGTIKNETSLISNGSSRTEAETALRGEGDGLDSNGSVILTLPDAIPAAAVDFELPAFEFQRFGFSPVATFVPSTGPCCSDGFLPVEGMPGARDYWSGKADVALAPASRQSGRGESLANGFGHGGAASIYWRMSSMVVSSLGGSDATASAFTASTCALL